MRIEGTTARLVAASLFAVSLVACSSDAPADRWPGQVTFLALSDALPRNDSGERVAADAELWIDGTSVWRGDVSPQIVKPEVRHVSAPVLAPGAHEFRLRVGEREWIDQEDVPEGVAGEMHLHCSQSELIARWWEEPIAYE